MANKADNYVGREVKGASTSDEVLKQVASRIKLARQMRRLTLTALAAKMGITNKQMQNYECGCCNIGIVRLWQLACLLDVRTEFFVGDLNNAKTNLTTEQQNLLVGFSKIRNPDVKKHILELLKEI